MQVLIPNALQPAEVEEVILCQMLGRAIVLVREDQLSLAIGRRGQNVRLASKLCGWDIEIMTRDELDEQIEQAVTGFSSLEGVEPELAEKLVGEGFLSYDDLSVIEPDSLMEMGGLSEAQANAIVAQAEVKAMEAEKLAAQQRRAQRERDKIQAGTDEVKPQAPVEAAAGDAAPAAGDSPVAAGDAGDAAVADAQVEHPAGGTEPIAEDGETTAIVSPAVEGSEPPPAESSKETENETAG
jgi:transcription termination/antitermination protein NusA